MKLGIDYKNLRLCLVPKNLKEDAMERKQREKVKEEKVKENLEKK